MTKYFIKFFSIIICAIVASTFLFAGSTKAESQTLISKMISSQEIWNGYKIEFPENQGAIEITPNSINRSAYIEIEKINDLPEIPKDKDLISGVFHYSILPATQNKLASQIIISLGYSSSDAIWKEVYFYNQELNLWQRVHGNINVQKNQISIQTNCASGFIAVMADRLNKSEDLKEKINSPTILIVNTKTGKTLVERQSTVVRPIASLTKLMTAAVFLDYNPGWTKQITITPQDDAMPVKIYIKPGEKLTVKDLFYATMLKSANNAAKALARSTGLPNDEFIKKMNEKAAQLGMTNTHFEEVTGLSEKNVSTARDLMILSQKLFSDIIFLRATTPSRVTIATIDTKKKIILENSNSIINKQNMPYTVLGSKTGFTYEAGRCLDMKVKNKSGKEIISIIMGADKPGAQWDDGIKLINAALTE
jgi:serine-type D-Ala-D-Ala endopeptidase (penicillin-binding protein 7)